ncbi:MAG: hypothetical protein ACLFPL_02685 [Candidatus Nanoarchaeia archaeon]
MSLEKRCEDFMSLEKRLRNWGLVVEELKTKQLPTTNTGIYIHPELLIENGYYGDLYGVVNGREVGLSRRRVGIIEGGGNEFYSPAFTRYSNYGENCLDINAVKSDERVVDLFKKSGFGLPVSYVITPDIETIKRLHSLRYEFEKKRRTFPKIIMIPWNTKPLLITKNSKCKSSKNRRDRTPRVYEVVD